MADVPRTIRLGQSQQFCLETSVLHLAWKKGRAAAGRGYPSLIAMETTFFKPHQALLVLRSLVALYVLQRAEASLQEERAHNHARWVGSLG